MGYQDGMQTREKLAELDADGDGKISREEWIARYGSDAGFDQYDLDGDGIIDANEFRMAKCAEIQFTRLDADGDGKITREEWIAKYGSDAGFDMYDLDGDGIIDSDEFRKCKVAEIGKAQGIEFNPNPMQPVFFDAVPMSHPRNSPISVEQFVRLNGSDDGYAAYLRLFKNRVMSL